jgi:hypothetical protein
LNGRYKEKILPLCIDFWNKSTGGKFDTTNFEPCKITVTDIQSISGEIIKELNDLKIIMAITSILTFKIKH